ncbi:unnamed protein product [Plutella xylostella]|uniref:(diamondback moth) hypothetical protein n=1 Tax=Plutella xylostella TaxID=51655 RepID=A0A8S4GCA9_PLUXY|nr:unnamed protein product [Plutella xylostella]
MVAQNPCSVSFSHSEIEHSKGRLLLLGVLCCRSPHPTKHKNAVRRQIDRPCSQVCHLQQHSPPEATGCRAPALPAGPRGACTALGSPLLPDHLGDKGH